MQILYTPPHPTHTYTYSPHTDGRATFAHPPTHTHTHTFSPTPNTPNTPCTLTPSRNIHASVHKQYSHKCRHAPTLPTYLHRTVFSCCMTSVGQNRMYTLYVSLYLVKSLPKLPYVHYTLHTFWPTLCIKHKTHL
jgi:hypothetical protein